MLDATIVVTSLFFITRGVSRMVYSNEVTNLGNRYSVSRLIYLFQRETHFIKVLTTSIKV